MMEAYQQTLDGLMQKAVDDSNKLNQIQLIILALEGLVIGTLSVAIMWYYAGRAVGQRYAVLSIFMAVPAGIIRTLATAPVNVDGRGENNVADDGDADIPVPVMGGGGEDFFDPEAAPLPVNGKSGGPGASAKVSLVANFNNNAAAGGVTISCRCANWP